MAITKHGRIMLYLAVIVAEGVGFEPTIELPL